MRKVSPANLQSITTALTIFLGGLFIAYCLVYLCACPSPALAAAVSVEVICLIISIIVIRAKIFSLPDKLLAKIPESLRRHLAAVQHRINWCKMSVLSILVLFAVTDFAALTLSVAGLRSAAVLLYTALPATYWIGLHPAFSLEMLAGALVENRDFERAEPFFKEVLEIRTSLCGPESDLASAIYADLGDLYVRKHDLLAAEQWYRRTVAIGPRTGRGYTALATVLREQGRFVESQQYYLKALALRKRIYGASSRQYGDTQRGYLRLQQLIRENRNRTSSVL
jgi:tetratricopeptide (TPR) repeat protein